jgi:hypothetical protein
MVHFSFDRTIILNSAVSTAARNGQAIYDIEWDNQGQVLISYRDMVITSTSGKCISVRLSESNYYTRPGNCACSL